MAEEKVYTPTVVTDQPFPDQDKASPAASETGSGGSSKMYKPQELPSANFPRKFIAHETISSSLNTKSKKILQEFEFTQSGAIQVGNYEPGVSGDIRISPNGLVGRNSSGLITFAIDGDTGNAVFAGELQTGSLITGDILIQGDGAIRVENDNSSTVIDAYGLVSVNNFTNTSGSSANGIGQQLTNSTVTDIVGASFTFTLLRPSKILIMARVSHYFTGVANCRGNGVMIITLDGNETDRAVTTGGMANLNNDHIGGGDSVLSTSHLHNLDVFTPGSHTIKLRAYEDVVSGSPIFIIYSYRFSYLILGT